MKKVYCNLIICFMLISFCSCEYDIKEITKNIHYELKKIDIINERKSKMDYDWYLNSYIRYNGATDVNNYSYELSENVKFKFSIDENYVLMLALGVLESTYIDERRFISVKRVVHTNTYIVSSVPSKISDNQYISHIAISMDNGKIEKVWKQSIDNEEIINKYKQTVKYNFIFNILIYYNQVENQNYELANPLYYQINDYLVLKLSNYLMENVFKKEKKLNSILTKKRNRSYLSIQNNIVLDVYYVSRTPFTYEGTRILPLVVIINNKTCEVLAVTIGELKRQGDGSFVLTKILRYDKLSLR